MPFSITPVTLVPMGALINVEPLPVPEFVIVPQLFTELKESVILPGVALLLLRIRLPVPTTPPETVSGAAPLASVKAVPPLLTVIGTLLKPIMSAEPGLFSEMAVTLPPTGPLIVAVAVPVPELVIVPVLFTTPLKVIVAELAPLALSVILPVFVQLPDSVAAELPLFHATFIVPVQLPPPVEPLPMVNEPPGLLLVTKPPLLTRPKVWELPPKSNVPVPLVVKALPLLTLPPLPSRSVPPETVVVPV